MNFDKKTAEEAEDCVKELLDLIPKSKKPLALGAANELFLFLSAAKRAAPEPV